MNLHVDSEVGRLKQVILHRPDLELKRLTPSNKDEFLFDDVLWVKRAKQEHDAFAESLRDLDVDVYLLEQLLRETVAIPEAKKYILDNSLLETVYGPMAIDALYNMFASLDDETLVEHLVGGITKRELLEHVEEPPSVVLSTLDLDDLLLAPLPNHMFTRDTSAWIYDGVSINAMRKRARSARPSTTRRSTAGTRCSPVPSSTSGPKGRSTGWPPPRAATSSCSAVEPCWSG
jgi:arginine deiminase